MTIGSGANAWAGAGKRDWFILRQLVGKDFKLKYRRSVLGVLWSVLNPLLMMIVMAIVFTNLMNMRGTSDIPNFPLYIILGNISFNLMSEATSSGMTSIIGAAALLKKVKINRWVFPLEKVLFAMVNFGFSCIAVVLVMLFEGIAPTFWILLLPIWLVVLGIFCVGVSLLIGSLSVFFRDIIHLWGVVLIAWTYLTPLFYSADIWPEWLKRVEMFNPMYHFVNVIRDLVLYGRCPNMVAMSACAISAVAALLLGYVVFRKQEHKFILFI